MKILEGWEDQEHSSGLSYLSSYLLRIADFEARQVGAPECNPCHLFLAVLKAVDVDLATIDFGLPLFQRDPILISMLSENKRLRKVYALGKVDARLLRKAYREKIRISDDPTETDGKVLKCSDSTNDCIIKSKELSKGSEVNSLHFLKIILEENVSQRDELMKELGISKTDLSNIVEFEIGSHLS